MFAPYFNKLKAFKIINLILAQKVWKSFAIHHFHHNALIAKVTSSTNNF